MSKGPGTGSSPKSVLNREYGQQIYKIRGMCSNLRTIQSQLGVDFVKSVDDLQAKFEDEAKRQYKQRMEELS